MIELNLGNVLLKPAHRRQLSNWLKRVARLGQRIGGFVLKLTLHRVGRSYEVRASVHDAAGDIDLRSRQRDYNSGVAYPTRA